MKIQNPKLLIKKRIKDLEKIFRREGIVLAYLFGSASKGNITPLSDIDIAVLFLEKVNPVRKHRGFKSQRFLKTRSRDYIHPRPRGLALSNGVKKEDYFDKELKLASEIDKILGVYKTEVISLNETPPLLKHRAVFNGILIFNSNSELKREFELRVLQEYEDFRYFLETGYKIMERHIKKGTFGKAPLVSKHGD